MRKLLLPVSAFFVLFLIAATSNATTLVFEGVLNTAVNDPNKLFDTVLGFTPEVGSTISGSLTYSPSAIPISGPTPFGADGYTFKLNPADIEFQAQINGMTPLLPFDDEREVTLFNDIGSGDTWALGVYLQADATHRLAMSISLNDSTASFLSDPSVFRFPEPIGAFDSAGFVFFDTVPAVSFTQVAATTVSVREVSVPEPATLGLLSLGLLGFGFARRTNDRPPSRSRRSRR